MKWQLYKGSKNCFVNENYTVMKADNLEELSKHIPDCIFDSYAIESSSNLATVKTGTVKFTNTFNEEVELKAVMLVSENAFSVLEYSLIKKFIQKSSKFYIGKNFYPTVIKNKNYVVLIASLSLNDCDYKFTEDSY